MHLVIRSTKKVQGPNLFAHSTMTGDGVLVLMLWSRWSAYDRGNDDMNDGDQTLNAGNEAWNTDLAHRHNSLSLDICVLCCVLNAKVAQRAPFLEHQVRLLLQAGGAPDVWGNARGKVATSSGSSFSSDQ